MLPTYPARGLEAPERKLEAFSRRTLGRSATKIRIPHFVQIHPGYTSFCPFDLTLVFCVRPVFQFVVIVLRQNA